LVNEQIQVSLLLAFPGVTAHHDARAPGALDLLHRRIHCRGGCPPLDRRRHGTSRSDLASRLHRGREKIEQAIFFAIDLAWTIFNLIATWLCVQAFGLEGAGIAFCVSYLFHGLVVYPIVRRLSGFRLSAANQRTAWLCYSVIVLVVSCCPIG
jgi:PST family polysaccharide transporter